MTMTAYESWLAAQEVPEPPENTYKTALVIDGKVVETMSTDERLWAILNSNPTLVDFTNITFPNRVTEDGDHQVVITTGWNYDGTTFTPPTE
jgi:hypothetical protein